MADWQRFLNLHDAWEKYDAGRMTLVDFARVFRDNLRDLAPFTGTDEDLNAQKMSIVEELTSLLDEAAAGGEVTVEEFNAQLEEAYTWGDQSMDNVWPPKKVCWIALEFELTEGQTT